MTASLSLSNKTVLVPREQSQAKRFSLIVEKYEGIPIEVPLLAFKPIEVTAELREFLNGIGRYDWIIFTSKVTIDTFLTFTDQCLPTFPKIAAIGRVTADYLTEKGFKVDFIPTEYVAETFAIEFSSFVKKGTKVFIPKGNLARDHISNELIKLGAEVDEFVVYETYCPEESKEKLADLLSNDKLDIIPFTSPSTATHFMKVVEEYGLGNNIRRCIFAAIGPVAKKRAESLGVPIHIVPTVYTVEDMIIKIAEYVNNHL
jgi:uroporphyrinogen-III synthase